MINWIKDVDLYQHLNDHDIILIGTNLYQQMANGIQLQVMLNYPYVYDKNLETKYGDNTKIGTIVEASSEGEPTMCLCFICKGNFRPFDNKDYLNYEALESCLKLVNIRYKGKDVACPLLGVSEFEGNGDRDRIVEIFKKTIKDVNLTIYDYRQKSRAEQMKEVWLKEQEAYKTDRDKFYKMVGERKKAAEERFKKNGHRRY